MTTTNLTAETITMAPRQPNRYRGALTELATQGHRWVGRCRACNVGVHLDGRALADTRGDTLVLGADGLAYTTRILNSAESVNYVHACGKWTLLRRVYDGGKPDSKRHVCGARCTNATGPSCDCKCRGANHGSGAGAR